MNTFRLWRCRSVRPHETTSATLASYRKKAQSCGDLATFAIRWANDNVQYVGPTELTKHGVCLAATHRDVEWSCLTVEIDGLFQISTEYVHLELDWLT
jgi:hypothetical protein